MKSDFDSLLTEKGFRVVSSGNKVRNVVGTEDVYLNPDFSTYKCYVGPIEPNGPIVFHTGQHNATEFDKAHRHSYTVSSPSNGFVNYVWELADFQALMRHFPAE